MTAKNVGINSTFEQQRLIINQIAVDIDSLQSKIGTAGTVITVTSESFVGIGSTNPQSRLTVNDGDISVGVNTSNGLILTSPNGTKYRLIVDDSGVISTVTV